MLLLAMALACLTVAAPRQCVALAISRGLPFYAQDMEFYYQHHRVDTLPGILRTFDSQGVLRDSLKQLMLAAFLGQVLRDPASLPTAEAIMDLLQEHQERVVVGLNASGQVRELQLRLRIRFKLRASDGRELIPDTELLQQRDISYNETIALAKEAEEALLYRNMQTDLVQQLLRRLAAVKR